jgi:glycine dehydrogenase subunit 1
MYDGASSLAEAVLMANRVTKRRKVLLSETVHPEYRKVIRTYIDPGEQELIPIPYDIETGRTDEKRFLDLLDGEVSSVVIQNPNFFGVIEDLTPIAEKTHEAGGLMVAGFSEAAAYGILKPPGRISRRGRVRVWGFPFRTGAPIWGFSPPWRDL